MCWALKHKTRTVTSLKYQTECKVYYKKKDSSHWGGPGRVIRYDNSDVTLLFEHLPSGASEIEHFKIFSQLRENQLAQRFFVKFNLLLFFLMP